MVRRFLVGSGNRGTAALLPVDVAPAELDELGGAPEPCEAAQGDDRLPLRERALVDDPLRDLGAHIEGTFGLTTARCAGARSFALRRISAARTTEYALSHADALRDGGRGGGLASAARLGFRFAPVVGVGGRDRGDRGAAATHLEQAIGGPFVGGEHWVRRPGRISGAGCSSNALWA